MCFSVTADANQTIRSLSDELASRVDEHMRNQEEVTCLLAQVCVVLGKHWRTKDTGQWTRLVVGEVGGDEKGVVLMVD